ncbi:glycosyltransferase [Aquisphaera insulae]|uniref:glycosyltransferase n=1 Tax=Aquisphaera insulae TaxID=2712864 RepID=UPI0013ED5F0F|nr:glycosyltransferase [Aquisphaera insulae]
MPHDPAEPGRKIGTLVESTGSPKPAGRDGDPWQQARRLRAENSRLRAAYRSLRLQEQALRAEAASMEQRLAALTPGSRSLVEHAGAHEGSLGWLLVQKAGAIRRRIFREGRLSGRCWRLLSRFATTLIVAGPRVAVRKAVRKIRAKLTGARPSPEGPAGEATPVGVAPTCLRGELLELPWRYLGDAVPETDRSGGHFKVLLVSHEATRTGAPLCLLELAEKLSKMPDVECRVVLKQGGELADAFARIAPTLDLAALGVAGHGMPQMARTIADRFRGYSSRGMAICNTAAVGEFHAAFEAQKIPVLSWVHELPVWIAHLGGRAITDQICSASRRIVVPADAVRNALIDTYDVSPDSLRTLHYGLEPRTQGLDAFRSQIRTQVRRELGIPEDAPIVLGCGTADFRKGAELFAQVCRLVQRGGGAGTPASKAWFVWVGAFNHTYTEEWLLHDSRQGAPEGRLVFTGPREDTVPYFLAADLFALTSREDPCPFVNLEAMESSLPVVAFADSGGAPEVLKDAGLCVPYLDVIAMADSVRELLDDPTRRAAMGREGRATIRDRFTWDRFMGELVDILRDDFGYHPRVPLRVSVVVPNFRHARYLEQRLRSIFNQTVLPHEIIFLDNASPDDSVEVARRLSRESPVPMKILVNETNNGSTFRQWMKGLAEASGDLVWIAEADDACDPRLLERLVPEFYDPDVSLAYAQSAIIGADGELLSADFLAHTDDLSRERWLSPFSSAGHDEVERSLIHKNTIPNASGVVFRRPPGRPEFANELEAMRFAGDWLFYAMQLRAGKISYAPEILNLFRRHPSTNTHQVVREDTYVEETLYVKARIMETFRVSLNSIASTLGRSVVEYDELTRRFNLDRPAFTANPRAQAALGRIREHLRSRHEEGGRTGPGILLVADDLGQSDEPSVAIRLANALSTSHRVFLCVVQPRDDDPETAYLVNDDVVLLEGTLGRSPTTLPVEPRGSVGLSGQPGRSRILRELIRIHEIDVIHSLSRTADRLVLDIVEGLDMPWLSHLDGAAGDADPSILLGAIRSAAGVFHETPLDHALTRQSSHRAGPRLIPLPARIDIPSMVSICSKAYLQACEDGRRRRETTARANRVA